MSLSDDIQQILDDRTEYPHYQLVHYMSGNTMHKVYAIVDIANGVRVSPEYGRYALHLERYPRRKSKPVAVRDRQEVEMSERNLIACMTELTRLLEGGQPKLRVPMSRECMRYMRLREIG